MVILRNTLAIFGIRPAADSSPDLPRTARPAETLEQHIMDANIPKSEAEWWAKRHIEALRTERAAWEVKFKTAVTDLEKQAEEIEVLKEKLGYAEWRAADDAVAAQKWHNSLKRSRDRKAAKKTTPPRDKRAKNRGGGK